ncbi:hypothetical protein ACHAWF_007070 [Thalassiosira exigua]
MKISLFTTLLAVVMPLTVVAQSPKGKQHTRHSQKGRDLRSPSYSNDWPEGKQSSDATSKSKGQEPNDRRGRSYCTYAPDYKCYKSGWPSCCNGARGSRACSRRRPSCDRSPIGPSTKSTKSTTDSTKRSWSSTRTTKRSSRSIRRRCAPDHHPRIRRDGQYYRFELVRSGAQCVDTDGEPDQYGQIDGVRDFGDYADACVQNVQADLLESVGFRGVYFDCRPGECRCLYDEGTLDHHNSREFDRASRHEVPNRTRRSRDTYCGRLIDSDIMDDDDLVAVNAIETW